jgi:2-oxoglutarate dehydrogenase E1 component
MATSKMEALAEGGFQEVLDDVNIQSKDIDTVVLCTGKFYYEMKIKAEELGVKNMVFIRIEQLYPWPQKQVNKILSKYKAKHIIWAQEEPENMGAWQYIAMQNRKMPIIGVSRPASAASAEGSKKLHEKRLEKLFKELFSFAKTKVHQKKK